MALCGGVGAMALPSELIVHIFSFLSDRDKLRASAVCSRWRECLFYPALWTELRLRIGGRNGNGNGHNGNGRNGPNGSGSSSDETPKLEFLMRKFGSFVRDLQLELAPAEGNMGHLNNDPSTARMDQPPGPDGDPQLSERWRDAMATYLDQVLCVFTSIRNNRIQQLLMELLSNSRQLRWLSCSFMLGLVTPCSLACLSNPSAETLQHLSLLDHQLGPLISPSEADRLSNLRSLALDFSDFTSELCGLLASPRRTPLHRLSLLLNGAALEFKPLEGTATDDDWKALVIQQSPLISPSEADRLSNLRSLALDFSDFTSELCGLLASPRRTPLHRLSLLLNGAALEFKPLEGTATDDDWKALVRVSANLRVYIMALEVDSSELLRVLKPSLPLERLHLDSYSTLVTDATLELISQQYNKTLTHFLLLRDGPDFPDLSVNRNEDPLVLLAWRCTQLAVLVIHGESKLGLSRY
ncbi:unnamed protein product [Menidia menidia]|uniref:(Atlantic silverside) hypothetical protein n=1 Tax=Menidia menidia TaxID=238744 RepID=A0A8S4AGU2_9TELE|nr:unnamed protein product [Menidia menidia]